MTEEVHKVVVTGGSGKAGRAVVRDLLEHGYAVVKNFDAGNTFDWTESRACERVMCFAGAAQSLAARQWALL